MTQPPFVTFCKPYGQQNPWNSDICIALSWMWKQAFDIDVGDLYEIVKVLYITEPDKIWDKIEKLVDGVFNNLDKIMNALQYIESKILTIDKSYQSDVDRVIIDIPTLDQVRTMNCTFPQFYTGEKIKEIRCGVYLGETQLGYIPATWIKGYIRETMHKLIFIKLLKYCLKTLKEKGSKEPNKLRQCFNTCILYLQLVASDDENFIFDKTGIVNLVSLLYGSGGLSSPLRIIYRNLQKDNKDVHEYEFRVDTSIYISRVIIEKLLFSGEDIKNLSILINNLDVVSAHLMKTSMLIQLPQPNRDINYIVFVPFTAGFGEIARRLRQKTDDVYRLLECYKMFVDRVTVRMSKDKNEALQESLNVLNKLLENYIQYFFKIFKV